MLKFIVLRAVLAAAVIAAGSLATALAAEARDGLWLYRVHEDPFDGDQHLAAVTDLTETAGFSCINPNTVTLTYVLQEKPDSTVSFDSAKARLLVIVDDSEKYALPAEIDTTFGADHYRFNAHGDNVTKLVFLAAAGHKRFAVAAEVDGKVASARTFSMRGSTKSLAALIKACKLEKPTTPALQSSQKGSP